MTYIIYLVDLVVVVPILALSVGMALYELYDNRTEISNWLHHVWSALLSQD